MNTINIYNKKGFFAVLLLAVLALTLIFIASARNGEQSAADSGRFTGVASDLLEKADIKSDSQSITKFVRKCAHFAEYFALCLFLSLAVYFAKGSIKPTFLSTVVCFAAAIIDEFLIQGNTAGRSPEWFDVLIDLCGAAAAQLITVIVISRVRKRKGNASG